MKRLLTIAFSAVLFALLYSWLFYVPNSQREANVYYFGFFETFILVVFYVGPIYLLAGLPLSILLDKLIVKFIKIARLSKYLSGLFIYSLAGALVGMVFIMMANPNIDRINMLAVSLFGFAASNLYFHSTLAISKIVGKLRD